MSNRAKTLLLLLVDLAILFFVTATVVVLRKKTLPDYITLYLSIFPIWILMFFIEGLYTLRTYNPANLPTSLIRSVCLSLLVTFIYIYLFPWKGYEVTPKLSLIIIAAVILPIMYMWRRFFFDFFAKDRRLRETVIIGSEETLKMVINEINSKPHLGYKIISTDQDNIPGETKLIAVERNFTSKEIFKKIFSMLGSVEIMDLAKFAESISGKIPIKSIDEAWFVEYCTHQESKSYNFFKLLIDKITAGILLIVLAPFAILFLPILILFHGRPIFFKQVRVGLNNKHFTLYKLRSMVVDAEKDGVKWAKPNDMRITKLGKFLRKTRIDELPQLINIIKGEMSLVGPRPERPEIIDKVLSPNIPFYNLRHLVKPGVTGWAQVTFRYGFSTEDSKEKLQFDLFYVKNQSLWLDMIVFLKTIKTVITGAGQ